MKRLIRLAIILLIYISNNVLAQETACRKKDEDCLTSAAVVFTAISQCNFHEVKRVIELHPHFLNSCNGFKETPLKQAEAIVKRWENIDGGDDYKEIRDYLKKKLEKEVIKAAQDGSLNQIKEILEKQPELINAKNENNKTIQQIVNDKLDMFYLYLDIPYIAADGDYKQNLRSMDDYIKIDYYLKTIKAKDVSI